MTTTSQFHLRTLTKLEEQLSLSVNTKHVFLDGFNLSDAQLRAISRPGTTVAVLRDERLLAAMQESVDVLHNALASGEGVYGVTTGYGGSANTRTKNPEALQKSLIHLLHVGISPPTAPGSTTPGTENLVPEPFVRASMAIRLNSVIRGHSGVTQAVVDSLVSFLNHNITPCVPLRGSISASGDLIPLAHIVACLMGDKDAMVFMGSVEKRQIVPATVALQHANIPALVLQPKEGLALLNGTSMSCAWQALQLIDTSKLAMGAHVLTAMTIEALNGSAGPYHPFVSDTCRPHPGQCDAAATLRTLIGDSKLVKTMEHKASIADVGLLAQDRYSVRTTPQWFGPLLEQLWLAQSQIAVELNSTTDNPLIGGKEAGSSIFNGGNFQASTVATVADTTRISIASLARAVFAQLSEVVNNDLNNGLTANLCGGEPSSDYGCKGIEISAASYMSEIAYLANPVTTHVQTAELQNQALNSLALISARHTLEAGRVLFMLMSNHLYALCQAVSLRVAVRTFASALQEELEMVPAFAGLAPAAKSTFANSLLVESAKAASLDSGSRFAKGFDAAVGPTLVASGSDAGAAWAALDGARVELVERTVNLWLSSVDKVANEPASVSAHLGATGAWFDFVRNELGVPFNVGGDQKHEISHYLGIIFNALQEDTIWKRLSQRLRKDAGKSGAFNSPDSSPLMTPPRSRTSSINV